MKLQAESLLLLLLLSEWLGDMASVQFRACFS